MSATGPTVISGQNSSVPVTSSTVAALNSYLNGVSSVPVTSSDSSIAAAAAAAQSGAGVGGQHREVLAGEAPGLRQGHRECEQPRQVRSFLRVERERVRIRILIFNFVFVFNERERGKRERNREK